MWYFLAVCGGLIVGFIIGFAAFALLAMSAAEPHDPEIFTLSEADPLEEIITL